MPPRDDQPAERATPPPRTPWDRLRRRFRFLDIQHPRIDHELARLLRHPASLQALLERSKPYMGYFIDSVEARDLPGELALLPAVESGFDPWAYSPGGAVGLWQFMPATARMLGLRQDRWYDGRRDLIRATRAALDYLQQLHHRLDGDWLHALAAYNSGIGTVRRAIRRAQRRGHSSSYWEIDLPAETDAYVPRLLALARIVRDPQRHGVTLPALAPNRPIPVEVAASLDLGVAARLAGLELERLLRLNPAFRRGVTPPGRSQLLLPADRVEAFRAALATLPRERWLRWAEHRIARGDTLGGIARRYGVSVSAVREANGLRGDRIIAGHLLRIPLSGAAADMHRGMPPDRRRRIRYRVRRGDSLYTIARKFSVSVRDLRRWNRVGRYIHPGQRLTLYVKAG